MRCRRHDTRWPWLAALAVAGASADASGQARYEHATIEPQWLRLDLREVSAGVQSEGTFDSSTYKNSGQTVSHENLFVGPFLGLRADGSVYHPDVLRYDLNSDGAFGYSYDQVHAGATQSRSQFEYLGRFGTDFDFLSGKPYNGSFFTSYDHTYRDNDFFNRVRVDTLRYGGRALWEIGKTSLTANYTHYDEESTSPFPLVRSAGGTTNQVLVDQKMVSHVDTIGFGARNERTRGGSSLNYTIDRYTRYQGDRLGEGTDHIVALGDSERLGDLEQFRLNSSLSYSRRDTIEEIQNDLSGNVNFGAEHTENLASFYDFNYEHFDTPLFDSDNYAGSATLTHQLYGSLVSSLTVRGSDNESSGDHHSGYTRQYGGGFSEAYTRRLGQGARLRLSNSFFVDQTDQQALTVVDNERHTLGEAGGAFPDSFYLQSPRVILSTLVLTDGRTAVQFLAGFDYQTLQEGARTRVQWLNPPGQVRPASILASYRTSPTPAGTYTTLTEAFEVRLDLWKDLLGLFARVSLSQNDALKELHVLDFTDYSLGIDSTWRWLRAGAEYEIYDSSESDYRAVRLFQSLVFRPDPASTFNLDFSETWVDYGDAQRPKEEHYRFVTGYHRALTHRLNLVLEGGVAWHRGLGVDQFMAAVRPSFSYIIGKTYLDAGYDYEYNVFQAQEERQKSLFFLRLRRVF